MIFSEVPNEPVAMPQSPASTRSAYWCAVVFLLLVIVPVTGEGGTDPVFQWAVPSSVGVHPDYIATDSSGSVYSTESLYSRVWKFTPEGALETRWGANGTQNGEFRSPSGITVNASGYVYVADTGNNRVQVFTPAGDYVTQWGGAGVLSAPVGIAINSTGFVYVTESEPGHRISVFTASGEYVNGWGAEGIGPGQFSYPAGLAINATGYVYVADSSNSRIQVFSPSGEYLAGWGSRGEEIGNFSYPRGIAVNASGFVFVADSYYSRIQVFTPAGDFVSSWGGFWYENRNLVTPCGIAVTAEGNIMVSDDYMNRISEFSPSGEYIRGWGASGPDDGQFSLPFDIAVNASRYVYVADFFNNRIQVFSPEGDYLRQWKPAGSENGQFVGPAGIAVHRDGRVYVSDSMNSHVQVFSADGRYLRQWGSNGSAQNQFFRIRGIAVNATGYVYVVDGGNNRIRVFTSTGTYVTGWGSEGTGNGQFSGAEGIAVNETGYVYVSDASGFQVFSPSGGFIRRWGGGSDMLRGIAVCGNAVLVADFLDNRIQKYTLGGTFDSAWGSLGTGPGEFYIPTGVACDDSRGVYVADSQNHRIQKFSYPPGPSFTVPSFVTDPGGALRPGTSVIVSYVVNFTGNGDETFPSGSELQMSTDLDNARWNYTLVLDGVETRQPGNSGRVVSISGWVLSYPASMKESLRVTLEGTAPAVSSPEFRTLVNVTEIDSHNAAAGAFTRRAVVVPAGTGPVSLITFQENLTISPGVDVTIPAGGTVVWVNDDPNHPHCVMARDLPTGILFGGMSTMCIAYRTPFAVPFDQEGEYLYRTVMAPELEGTITVTSEPVAAFTASPRSGTAPLRVNFTDLSTGSPAGRAWFFGDETYRQLWRPVNRSPGWAGREGFSTVVLPDGSVVLTGGQNNYGDKNDVWRSSDMGVSWTLVNDSAGWSPRVGHRSVAMPDGSIVLTGGVHLTTYWNDTWRSSDMGATWTRLNASSGWAPRAFHSSVVLSDGSVVLMGGGGRDAPYQRLNDVWMSRDNGTSWTRMNPGAGWAPRVVHSSVALPDNSIVLTGGFTGGMTGYMNDTWRSPDKGKTWYLVNASSGWHGRSGHSSNVMPDGSIILMGGSHGGSDARYLNDTWRSQDRGATWTRLTESSGWPERNNHCSVVMPDGSILLTGGDGSIFYDGIYRNDTWRFQPAGSVAKNPSHTFTRPGNYTVTLQVYDSAGYNRTTKTAYISVKKPALPAVTGITPASGTRGRLTIISNLSGAGFAAGAAVSLNRTGYPPICATNVTLVNAKKISCSFSIPDGAPLGYRNVDVKNANGKMGTKVNAFLVKAPAAPTVTALDPATGVRGSLVTVTNLSGTGFVAVPTPKVQLVRSGTVIAAGNVTVVNARKISCTFAIPAGAATGSWHARVTNGDQQTGVMNGAFTVTV